MRSWLILIVFSIGGAHAEVDHTSSITDVTSSRHCFPEAERHVRNADWLGSPTITLNIQRWTSHKVATITRIFCGWETSVR